jgi:hypothetical protein
MKQVILLASAFFFVTYTNSAVISKIEISSEKAYGNSDLCNYSEKATSTIAENIAKRRGIYVGKGGDELVLYIEPNLMPIENSKNCAGYLQIEFKYYELIKIKGTDKLKYGSNIICRRGKNFIFPKSVLQEKIEEIIKNNIEDCFNEILKIQ